MGWPRGRETSTTQRWAPSPAPWTSRRRRTSRTSWRSPRRPSTSGGTPRSPSAPRSCSRSGSCSTPARSESPRSSPPSTARSSPTRSARSPGAQEVVEFACGIPHLLKGGFTERRLDQGRRLLDPPAARAWSAIISPFNFPAMVPMWFFPIAIAAGNTVILKPSEKDPSAIMLDRRAVGRGRAARRGLQRRARRQGVGRRAADPPRRQERSRSSARRRSRGTSTRPAPRTASASRRSAAPRTTWSCCRTPTSTSPRTLP